MSNFPVWVSADHFAVDRPEKFADYGDHETDAIEDFFSVPMDHAHLVTFRKLCNATKSDIISLLQKHCQVSGRATVLDFGCGRGGDVGKWALHRPKKYIGLDICEQSIQDAEKRHLGLVENGRCTLKADFLRFDANCEIFPCNADSVDIISSNFSLQYVFSSVKTAESFFSECNRVLRPGGVVGALLPAGNVVAACLRSSDAHGHMILREFRNTGVLLRAVPAKPVGIPYTFRLKGCSRECLEYVVSEVYLRELLEENEMEILLWKNATDIISSSIDAPVHHLKICREEITEEDWKSLGFFIVVIARKPAKIQCPDDLPPLPRKRSRAQNPDPPQSLRHTNSPDPLQTAETDRPDHDRKC